MCNFYSVEMYFVIWIVTLSYLHIYLSWFDRNYSFMVMLLVLEFLVMEINVRDKYSICYYYSLLCYTIPVSVSKSEQYFLSSSRYSAKRLTIWISARRKKILPWLTEWKWFMTVTICTKLPDINEWQNMPCCSHGKPYDYAIVFTTTTCVITTL